MSAWSTGSVTADPKTLAELRRETKLAAKHSARKAALIRQAIAEGGTLREVGAAANLSHQAVKFIVKGRT